MELAAYIPDYVVFDLETTGISCNYDEVVEISAIKVRNHQAVSEFTTLVNPGRAIPRDASGINGITDDMVKDAPVFKTALADFLSFIENDALVGHNIDAFDLKFIYRDCGRYFGKLPGNDSIDTLKLARVCLPKRGGYRLTDLAAYYGISTQGAHRALNDCHMTQAVYERLGKEFDSHPSLVKKCPRCGALMQKRKGRFGMFWGCSGYPKCRYTENL